MVSKRRTHLRIRPSRPLLANYPNYLGRVRDIGPAGAFIESDRPLLPGKILPITFWLDVERSVEIDAVVRRVESLRGMGVEFLNMTGEGMRLLCNYWDVKPPLLANDRRTSLPRIKPKKMVLVEYPNYLSRVRDLSPVGAFIEDRRYLPPGQHVSLKLWLDSISPIPIDVTVRRVDEGHGIGGQFASLKESDYDRLRQFCRAQPQQPV